MNKSTADRYERIGAILNQIALQRKITPLERLLFEELEKSDKPFTRSLQLLRLLQSSDDLLAISEIAAKLENHEETTTAMVRSIKVGGFEFVEDWQTIGTANYLLIGWNPKPSALTHLLGGIATTT